MNKTEQELRRKSPVQIRNKKASFLYNFIDTYTEIDDDLKADKHNIRLELIPADVKFNFVW